MNERDHLQINGELGDSFLHSSLNGHIYVFHNLK